MGEASPRVEQDDEELMDEVEVLFVRDFRKDLKARLDILKVYMKQQTGQKVTLADAINLVAERGLPEAEREFGVTAQ
jgi:hypothetical protein